MDFPWVSKFERLGKVFKEQIKSKIMLNKGRIKSLLNFSQLTEKSWAPLKRIPELSFPFLHKQKKIISD